MVGREGCTRWEAAPPRARLARNEVHVWRAALVVDPPTMAVQASCLSREERLRAERFHFAEDRDRWLLSRSVLRQVLALYLGGSPSSINIACTGYGKPFISGGNAPAGLCFNLSHSGDYAVYTLSAGRQVGIDIQRSAVLRLAEVASGGFFSAEEAAVLGKLGEKEQSLALLRCWTRKEALVKATGEGVSAPLAEITVPSARGRCSFLRAMPGETAARLWSLIDLEVAPGYAASLAVEGDVELREWEWRWSRRVPRGQAPGHLAPRVGPVGDTPPSRSIR